MNIFTRLKDGLSKTRSKIAAIVGVSTQFNNAFYASLEEALVAADIGLDCSLDIIEKLRAEIAGQVITTTADAYRTLKDLLVVDLSAESAPQPVVSGKPWVVLVVGVNGVGKTTTIGKLANGFRQQGKSVLLGACDTFRAGAIEQLKIWAQRTSSEFVAQHEGADPASVGFDAMAAAVSRNVDVVILDTAGRLHNKVNLMNELEKIQRVITRHTPSAPQEILLVLDATTGQNALNQARVFNDLLGLTGLVITKLDGTAKGGIAFALARELKVPIRKIGVGETIDDLQDFNAREYVEAMFGELSS
ncbi:MAG: signal recognition particle-docking protein FtsY [Chitinispirillaceae bacterium]|jgi:fused signal recognition particle receptor|nr:signal recognition particle-docking protein FtsY [Chitinispirillaceae bacterium]